MSEMTSTPVAIIGMSCRFAPDLDTPEKLWEFLAAGRSAVAPMPEKRWRPYAAGSPEATTILRNTTLLGSYLDDIEGFDAEFFGTSPTEAAYLDPQQRFMLELTWEALVSAGIPPLSLRGTDAGVYSAVNSTDYGRRLLEDVVRTGAYAVNGTTDYGIANRVSYFLDTRGPSMAVNTACAASLTAIDIACRTLRAGDIPLAVVGGMNIMSTPALNIALEGAGALAPDGRSKAFDDAADGYGRGEGAGVLVLKRLEDARRDGDPVLALIRGGGVFQDGRSDGMMAPRSDAQAHMLRTAYDRAGVDPATLSYVEAHGTGTPTGDAAELRALGDVVGAGRPAGDPCYVGSLKPNIGHVEGGSGIASIIKVVLAMRHESLPPSRHTTPTTAFDWQDAHLELVRDAVPWPATGPVRRAGVSNYGVGGTIAHVVLEEAPRDVPAGTDGTGTAARPAATSPATAPPVAVVPLSAASAAGTRDLAGASAAWLRDHPAELDPVVHTLSDRRSHLRHRAAVAAPTTETLLAAWEAAAQDAPHGALVTGTTVPGADAGAVWVFSGHGSQWEGMGAGLLDVDAAFTRTVDELAAPYREELGWTPREAITGGGPWSAAEVQALIFAIQCALARSWQAQGLEPAAVVGHSVGEIAASVVAGVLPLDAAARFACRRATALQRLAGHGAMAMVSLPFDEAATRVRDVTGVEVGISASPTSTVITGDVDSVAALTEKLESDDVVVRPIATDIAFHSSQVDAVVGEVVEGARDLAPRPAACPLYSTALDDPRGTDPRGAEYWGRNVRGVVHFTEATTALIEDGYGVFLEIAPHPVVLSSVSEVAESLGATVATVPTLRRAADDPVTVARHRAQLFCAGIDAAVTGDAPRGALLPLPGTAWQHRDHWIFAETDGARIGAGHDPAAHSLLGGRLSVSGSPAREVWQTRLDLDSRPYPLNHELVGVEVTPAASILNTFLQAAPEGLRSLHDIVLRTPLAVVPPRTVQVVREGRTMSLATRVADAPAGPGDHWITHTTAALRPTRDALPVHLDVADARRRLPHYDRVRMDDAFHRMGVSGYAFGWSLGELRRDHDELIALLTLTDPAGEEPTSWAHVIDGALTISAALVTPDDATSLWMSRHITSVDVLGEAPPEVLVHSVRSAASPDDSVDVTVATPDGTVIGYVVGLRFSSVDNLEERAAPRDLVHETVWEDADLATSAAAPDRVVLVGDGARTAALADGLGGRGVPVLRRTLADPIDLPDDAGQEAVVLVLPGPADEEGVADAAVATARLVTRTAQAVIAASSPGTTRRLWVLSQGVREAAGPTAVSHAPAWGIGRIVAGEHPEIWGGTLDLGHDGGSDGAVDVDLVARALAQGAGREDVLAADDGTLVAPRLTTMQRPADAPGLTCTPAGTALIVGGLGDLGLEAARWLAARGQSRLVLAGRTALPARADWPQVTDPAVRARIDAVTELEALGVSVRTVSLDVGDREALHAFLDDHARNHPPVTGVVHAAGVTRDMLLDETDPASLGEVMAAKAHGAWALHEAFEVGTLDYFVMFSSCGQLAQLSGQTAYAAANSVLDAIAAVRSAGGEAGAVSLAWTSWLGLGLSRELGTTMLEANVRGLGAVSAGEALDAWEFAGRFSGPYKAVLRSLPVPSGMPVPPAFRALGATDDDGGQEDVFVLDGDVDEAAQRAAVTAGVADIVTAELNLEPGTLDHARPLVELGVDSVMGVALRVRLQRWFGVDFPSTVLWTKPTVRDLGAFVHESLTAELV